MSENPITGNHCNLFALQGTALIHPFYPDAKASLFKDQELPIAAWSQSQGMLTFTLEGETLAGKNTWIVNASHVRMEEAQPENDPIIQKPDHDIAKPQSWTHQNLVMGAAIRPLGNFSWAEATKNGSRMPPNQEIVNNIIAMAEGAQQVRRRLGKPMTITSWYRPSAVNRAVGGAIKSQHVTGKALDFLVPGMSGKELYEILDPWWLGGLGRYPKMPNIVHIDIRGYRARWGG